MRVSITEHNVVQHIKERNERAIPFLIQTYGGLLQAIIKQHVHFNQQEYEECLDDVLLAVWNNIDAFDRNKNTFKQWIAAIAKYRAIDYQRKMIKNQQRFVQMEITDAHYYKQQHGTTYDIEQLLASLSDVERAIFQKYYLEGLSSDEVADQLKVQKSWIYNKLSRGRKKLKKLFISNKEV